MNTNEAPKKGNAVWKPAQRLNVVRRDPEWRYRWVNSDPANIDKRLAEGWVFAEDAKHDRAKHIEDGTGIGTAKQTYRDLTLMKMREDMARARTRYYQDQTEQQVRAVAEANMTKQQLNRGGAGVYGHSVTMKKENVEIT
jgi:hypothetical protein